MLPRMLVTAVAALLLLATAGAAAPRLSAHAEVDAPVAAGAADLDLPAPATVGLASSAPSSSPENTTHDNGTRGNETPRCVGVGLPAACVGRWEGNGTCSGARVGPACAGEWRPAPPENGTGNRTPPRNHTPPEPAPPGNGTGNQTQPPRNETEPNGTAPPPACGGISVDGLCLVLFPGSGNGTSGGNGSNQSAGGNATQHGNGTAPPPNATRAEDRSTPREEPEAARLEVVVERDAEPARLIL